MVVMIGPVRRVLAPEADGARLGIVLWRGEEKLLQSVTPNLREGCLCRISRRRCASPFGGSRLPLPVLPALLRRLTLEGPQRPHSLWLR